MGTLTELLTSGAVGLAQNTFQNTASQGLQNVVGTGADIYNNQQLRNAEQDRITQINQGFNQARGDIQNFGDKAIGAVTAGGDTANQAIRDATGRAVETQQPFYDSGLAALSEFESILQNPDQILNVPGVKFQYEQGLEATNRALESNNLLNSSARLNALTDYGQGQASTALDSALNRRLPLIQGGQNAANVMSQANITEGTNLANVNTQQGRTLADINLSMGENMADLSLGQNALLSNRNLADAVSQTGLLDILTGGSAGAGLPAEAGEPGFIEGLSDSVNSLFGGGAVAGGAAALGINTAPEVMGANLMGVTTGGTAALTPGATLGFGAGSTGTLAGAVTPGVGASQLGQFGGLHGGLEGTGQAAFGAPAGFGGTAGGGAEAGSTVAARGAPLAPGTAALYGGGIAGAISLLQGEGIGIAGSKGLGAAGGAALGAQLGAGLGPMGAAGGAILGGLMGSFAGGELGKALGLTRGGGEDKPDYSLVSTDGLKDNPMASKGPWGYVGFGHQKHLTGGERYKAGLDVVTKIDQLIADQLTPEENARIKELNYGPAGAIASNTNEGGFTPARMMSHIFSNRQTVLQQALGKERYEGLGLNEIYNVLGTGDPDQISQVFGG